MKTNEQLKTLKNGLMALRLINELGQINIADLARCLEITRTSAYRILATLESASYIAKIPHTSHYQLAAEIATLTSGFDEGARLAAIAEPLIRRLGKSIEWPVSLQTPVGCRMVARICTDFDSPLAITHVKAGDTTSLIQTNLGILYLALCPPDVANKLIKLLKSKGEYKFPPGCDSAEFARRIKIGREKQYLMLSGRPTEACVGVPLLWHGRMIGGIVTRYIPSAMTREVAAATLLPELQRTATRIIEKLDDRSTF